MLKCPPPCSREFEGCVERGEKEFHGDELEIFSAAFLLCARLKHLPGMPFGRGDGRKKEQKERCRGLLRMYPLLEGVMQHCRTWSRCEFPHCGPHALWAQVLSTWAA